MPIKTIIVDDENHGIITLKHLLAPFEEIQIVATTQDSTEAVSLIETHQPDLVFLDIQMPVLNGFDVIKQLASISFKLVFVTAYDNYAIKALKMNAFDYLLKPASKQDVEEVITKYKKELSATSKMQLQSLKNQIEQRVTDKIALSTQEGLIFIKFEEISYIEAEGSYSTVKTIDGKKHLVSKNIATFEDVLEDNACFFRPHKSFIFHLNHVKQYIRGEGGEIVMTDGKSIPLSRTKKQTFLELFAKV